MKFTNNKLSETAERLFQPARDAQAICPGCQGRIPAGSCFCYKCRQFVDLSANRVLDESEVSDQMLETLQQRSAQAERKYEAPIPRIRTRLGYGILIVGVLLTITLFFIHIGVPLIFVGLVVARGRLQPKEQLTEIGAGEILVRYLVPKVLREEFDTVEEYTQDKRLPTKLVHDISLTEKSYNSISGSDYIRGISQDLPFQMSRLVLVDKSSGADVTVFQGMVLATDPGTVPVGEMCIRGRKDRPDLGDGLLTGQAEFDRKFCVEADDPAVARRMLTAGMIQQILELERLTGNQITIQFLKNGRMCISLASEETILGQPVLHEMLPDLRCRIQQALQCSPQLTALLGQVQAQVQTV